MSQIEGWYEGIVKPSFSPPNWVFGPVWTTLYALMGTALWLVWESRRTPERRHAITAFAIQLVLNAIWSPIFFGLHQIGLAFAVILLLLAAIIYTMVLFYKVRPLAMWLLAPYLLWVAFASVLNAALWQLN